MIDEMCKEIMNKLDIHCLVETGTDMGETVAEVAKWFSKVDKDFGQIEEYITTGARGYNLGSKPIQYPIFKDVKNSQYKILSVDIDSNSFENAKNLFCMNSNIQLFCDSSTDFLKMIIDDDVLNDSGTIFYLDAHWGKYWPIKDELRQILRLEKFIIVIDDFFVPNRSNRHRPHGDFGFDFYYGRILDWGYISDLFGEVDTKIYYPSRPNRDGRGFVVLFNGYEFSELDFLNNLPFEYYSRDDAAHKESTSLSLLTYLNFRYLVRSLIPLSLLRNGIRLFQGNIIKR